MSEEKSPTREEKLAPLIAKAWSDEGYKKEFISNPKGVLQKEFGVEFVEGVTIEVLEESPTKLYIVIPQKPSFELSDEQLEAVAGGCCPPAAGVPAVIFGAALLAPYIVAIGAVAVAGIAGVAGGVAIGAGVAQGVRHGW